MGINDVIYEKNFDSHVTADRTIITLTGGTIGNFAAPQIRTARLERDADLGNHWRQYSELYGIIGEATFLLEDIDTHERKSYALQTGDRLLIPARVALKIKGRKGTVLLSSSPARVDREKQTHKYEIN